MDAAAIVFVLATLGVNFGWQPAEGEPAGYEYTVQIEPEIARMLERGESVPIESVVPPEVTPIRKVRIVVGRAALPRESLAVDAQKLEKYVARDAGQAAISESNVPHAEGGEVIVRGQSPDDVSGRVARTHTSAFAGETYPWENQSTGGANVDRYGNPIPGVANSVAPPPGFVDRVGNAVNETANSVGGGLERGFAEANATIDQTGQRLWQGAQNATQNFAEQFQLTDDQLRSATQKTLDAAGDQLQNVGQSFGHGGIQSPPSWSRNIGPVSAMPIAGGTPVRTATGWTTIGGNIAAPPLLPPSLTTTAGSASVPGNHGTRIAMNSSGPNFPIASSSNRQPPADNLSDQASGGASDSNSTTIPIRPVSPSVPTQQRSSSSWSDPWGEDPWPQATDKNPSVSAGGRSQDGARSNDGFSNSPSALPPEWSTNGSGTLSGNERNAGFPPRDAAGPASDNNTIARSDVSNTPSNGAPANQSPPYAHPPASAAIPPSTTAPGDTVPWTPLLLTGLGLVGSLSANFFLGWSYLDARQRYASLARKTAQSFRRRSDAA